MNVLSLFDGLSCGQIALNRAGIKYDNYYASEIDIHAIKVTQHNYPNTIQLGDIHNIKGFDLPNIDLLMGGSPCQSFSSAGSRTGFDGKSKLFWEFIRVLNEVKPKYFLLENVKMKKEWEKIITEEMGVEPILINSNLVSAQKRERLYWTNIPDIIQPNNKNIKFKDVLGNTKFREIPKCFYNKWGDKMRIDKGPNLISNEKSNCLTTKNCHTNQYLFNEDKSLCRLLTADEFERLQTIPEGYTSVVSNTERYKMIGNGWTVDVVAHIFKNIQIANKVYLIDIDGTICEDIRNEDSHLYPFALHYEESRILLNKWYDEGNIITFFTARESKDRHITEDWLILKGFKFHGLIMDKPRCKDGQIYHWIDNRPVRATTYKGNWTELKQIYAKIETFE